MSLALERTASGSDQPIELPEFVHCSAACVSPDFNLPDLSVVDCPDEPAVLDNRSGCLSSSSSTSSIGRNSDEFSDGGGGEGEEVQSEVQGGALDSLDELEEVLPAKKGISKFYCGKSKSFTSLSDAASCSSVKDITKPENAYTRKRKNLLAYKNLWDTSSSNITRGSHPGMLKKPTNSRSMLTLAAMNNCPESISDEISNSDYCLPPLAPHTRRTIFNELSASLTTDKFSSLRSFSLSDLQGASVDDASPGIQLMNQ